jgi:hypothetical protein
MPAACGIPPGNKNAQDTSVRLKREIIEAVVVPLQVPAKLIAVIAPIRQHYTSH